ncbi:hypothetical protein JYK14_26885 [Siccirubricoccus sp. KC 17139]|uniref:Uncharacterized protein n=1 Tax=Siccirubricoccus soli TaxID=2899147 RepID=A0ABT1DCV4_9PROT|nr:hypothetical protein [Siccirubricoccus soli]MCP2685898.1 hypothetical protein [Siccirubricoccus soli]
MRRDQERAAAFARLQHLVTQGAESGISVRSLEEVLEEAHRQARRPPG